MDFRKAVKEVAAEQLVPVDAITAHSFNVTQVPDGKGTIVAILLFTFQRRTPKGEILQSENRGQVWVNGRMNVGFTWR